MDRLQFGAPTRGTRVGDRWLTSQYGNDLLSRAMTSVREIREGPVSDTSSKVTTSAAKA